MKLNGYPISTVQAGDLLLGYRPSSSQPAYLFGGLENALGWITETVNISSAQLLTAFTSPITLLAAPEAGTYYQVDSLVFEFTPGSTPYGGPFQMSTSGCFRCVFEETFFALDDPTVLVASYSSNGLLDTEPICYFFPITAGLTLSTSSNPTSGNGTLRIRMTYKIVTFT